MSFSWFQALRLHHPQLYGSILSLMGEADAALWHQLEHIGPSGSDDGSESDDGSDSDNGSERHAPLFRDVGSKCPVGPEFEYIVYDCDAEEPLRSTSVDVHGSPPVDQQQEQEFPVIEAHCDNDRSDGMMVNYHKEVHLNRARVLIVCSLPFLLLSVLSCHSFVFCLAKVLSL